MPITPGVGFADDATSRRNWSNILLGGVRAQQRSGGLRRRPERRGKCLRRQHWRAQQRVHGVGHRTAATLPSVPRSSRTLPGGQNDAYRSQKMVETQDHLGNVGYSEFTVRCRATHEAAGPVDRGNSAMPVTYRQADSSDLTAGARVVQSAMNDLRPRYGLPPLALPPSTEFPAFWLASDPKGLRVAEEDEKLIGWSLSWMQQNFWFLSQLDVLPEKQGKGIG